MLSEVTQALELLQEMKQKHTFVSHKTGALHQACEQLMEDQMYVNMIRKRGKKAPMYSMHRT